MIRMTVSEAARLLGSKRIGEDALFTGISSDSRSIGKGQLFVALSGENFDGHAFVERARQHGAVAALVSKRVDVDLPQILVSNTKTALATLAQYWRSRFAFPMLAITGSNGKTTVKEMLRSILIAHTGDEKQVLATEGNLNNDIGVPLMMCALNAQHRYGVFELGMNHLGEINFLTRLLEPDVALINMVGTAHIGELGSREKIAEAKGEIFGGLKNFGTAVINSDDVFADYWMGKIGERNCLRFGCGVKNGVVAGFSGETINITYKKESISVQLKISGEHNQRNAVAAAAGAIALGVPMQKIKHGLETFTGVAARLQSYRGINNATIIDDTYNANPDSVKAAINVLESRANPRVLVIGDMRELGEASVAMHREVGEYARNHHIEQLFALGESSRETSAAFGMNAKHFESVEQLVNELKPQLKPETTVLVKGSRGMKMERVVRELVPQYLGGHH